MLHIRFLNCSLICWSILCASGTYLCLLTELLASICSSKRLCRRCLYCSAPFFFRDIFPFPCYINHIQFLKWIYIEQNAMYIIPEVINISGKHRMSKIYKRDRVIKLFTGLYFSCEFLSPLYWISQDCLTTFVTFNLSRFM